MSDTTERSDSNWKSMRYVVHKSNALGRAIVAEVPHPKTAGCVFSEDGSRVFFRGTMSDTLPSTLLSSYLVPQRDPDCMKCSRKPSASGLSCGCETIDLNTLPVLEWKEVFHNAMKHRQPTREEELLCERQRSAVSNISSFHRNWHSKSFLFSCAGSVYTSQPEPESASSQAPEDPISSRDGDDGHGGSGGVAAAAASRAVLREALPYRPSARLDLQWCPGSARLFAYVVDGDVWVSSVGQAVETRLTYCNNGRKALEENFVSAGSPSYITQEEFFRFTGFWWQDRTAQLAACRDKSGFRYRILYEQVDEHQVPIVDIPNQDEVERLRYPKPGQPNALSILRYVEFSVNDHGEAYDIQHYGLSKELHQLFPGFEYCVQAGWIPGSDAVWVYLMHRLHNTCQLVYIPLESRHSVGFRVLSLWTATMEATTSPAPGGDDVCKTCLGEMTPSPIAVPTSPVPCQRCVPITVLLKETSDTWVNPHDCLHFLEDECSSRSVSFLWASEASGYWRLQHVTCNITEVPVVGDSADGCMRSGADTVLPGAEERMDTSTSQSDPQPAIASTSTSRSGAPAYTHSLLLSPPSSSLSCQLCIRGVKTQHVYADATSGACIPHLPAFPHPQVNRHAGAGSGEVSSADDNATLYPLASTATMTATASATQPLAGAHPPSLPLTKRSRRVLCCCRGNVSPSSPPAVEAAAAAEAVACSDSHLVGNDKSEDGDVWTATSEMRTICLPSDTWHVDSNLCHVDERHKCAFFTGSDESPTLSHLYVVSYDHRHVRGGCYPVKRLTQDGYYHDVTISKCGRFVVSEFSSLSHTPATILSDIVYHGNNDNSAGDGNVIDPPPLPCVVARCVLGQIRTEMPQRTQAEPAHRHGRIFSFNSSSGHTLYGAVHPPFNCAPNMKYATVLHVYGGPQVQKVTDSYPSTTITKLNLAGFAVVEIDGRGSARRGAAFEREVNGVFGVKECIDQVEGLKTAADMFPFVDGARCGVFGWSYGGYMALLLLAKHPQVFKSAVSVAPVTEWRHYDTSYTERYLSLPSLNDQGYTQSSVLPLAADFPDMENRLLIIHGCADENVHYHHTQLLLQRLTSLSKPFQVLPLAGQRHCVRQAECFNFLYTSMLTFFLQSLCRDQRVRAPGTSDQVASSGTAL